MGAGGDHARYLVHIEDTGEAFEVAAQQTVLDGMAALGRKGIPSGCHGGGCGVCRIRVLQGRFRSMPMSRNHVSEQEEREGTVLACRIRPDSDLRLRVIGGMKKSVLRGACALGASTANKSA